MFVRQTRCRTERVSQTDSQIVDNIGGKHKQIQIHRRCSVGERKWKEEGEVFNSLIHREEGSI